MKKKIMYIEHKTDQNDRGLAWIGLVEYSKSGRTIYFNEQAFKTCRYGNFDHNFVDIETGQGYWISGVKKNGQDRHWSGGGKIQVQRDIVDEYLALVDFDILDPQRFELTDIPPTNKQRFTRLENKSTHD
ncbi:MAG: hypothetical protein Roseis2KO_08970 [Roseivirga sp.]